MSENCGGKITQNNFLWSVYTLYKPNFPYLRELVIPYPTHSGPILGFILPILEQKCNLVVQSHNRFKPNLVMVRLS